MWRMWRWPGEDALYDADLARAVQAAQQWTHVLTPTLGTAPWRLNERTLFHERLMSPTQSKALLADRPLLSQYVRVWARVEWLLLTDERLVQLNSHTPTDKLRQQAISRDDFAFAFASRPAFLGSASGPTAPPAHGVHAAAAAAAASAAAADATVERRVRRQVALHFLFEFMRLGGAPVNACVACSRPFETSAWPAHCLLAAGWPAAHPEMRRIAPRLRRLLHYRIEDVESIWLRGMVEPKVRVRRE
jgi:hypothetical protein